MAEVDIDILSLNVRLLDRLGGERLAGKSSALPDNDNGGFLFMILMGHYLLSLS